MTRTVLYTCSYVPEEVILAAGLSPRRFLPAGTAADDGMHPNTCGYVRSMLAAALGNDGLQTAAIVIANSCDAMRRLHDLWTARVPGIPALFLDVPRTADGDAVAQFAADLQRLAAALPGNAVDAAGLRAAVRACNARRRAMARVFAAQRSAADQEVGSRVFALCLEATTGTQAGFAERIERFLAQRSRGPGDVRRRRIVVAGGLVNRPETVVEIERAGAHVVALDTCLGLRHWVGLVDEDDPDPFRALARRYLAKPGCARMQGLEDRVRWTLRVAREAEADGIVLCSLKFCGPCVYDVPALAERCRAAGVPFLSLEHDYEGSGLAQLRSRVGAFVEIGP